MDPLKTLKYLKISLLILSIFVYSATAQTSPPVSQDAEEYRVYESLIAREWPVTVAKARRVVIQKETSDAIAFFKRDSSCLTTAKEEESIYAPLIKTYKEINEKPSLLESKFIDPLFFELVPGEKIRSFFGVHPGNDPNGRWKLFYKAYPDSGGYSGVRRCIQ